MRRRQPVRLDHAREWGWRVHSAQEAWTAKVDVKASILLALEGAILVALVAATASGGAFASLRGWREVFVLIGALSEVFAIVSAGAVVLPLLGSPTGHKRDHRDNLIYFGHLRHWSSSDDLAARMIHMSPNEEIGHLARQLIQMSTRNWIKHRFLQVSVITGFCGALLVLGAAVWP